MKERRVSNHILLSLYIIVVIPFRIDLDTTVIYVLSHLICLVTVLDGLIVTFQVTELTPEETESVTGGYGKSISHVIIGLKTVKGTKQLKLDPTIYDALVKEKVCSFYIIFCKIERCSFASFTMYFTSYFEFSVTLL